MKYKIPLLIIAFIIPVFCVILLLGGILGAKAIMATADQNGSAMKIDQAVAEAEIVTIAADYALNKDIDVANERLASLNLPNTEQYISFMVDRYIQENRESSDTTNLFILADALGATTPSMLASLATPTSIASPTVPPPTATPTPVDTPTPENSPTPTPTEKPQATATSEPTDTPLPPKDTPTHAPPTNTPEPTATPEPTKPAVDFTVQYELIRNPVYDSCPGEHQIFVTIVDVNGNPLDGVTVEDTGRAVPPHLSGEKGPGKLEYDLWSNGFSLEVTKTEDGSPATSELTEKLSSVDEDIPNEWLVAANYCRDLNDCLDRKGRNGLCRGHYAYEARFQKTY